MVSLFAGILVKSRFLFMLFSSSQIVEIFLVKLEFDLIKSPSQALRKQASSAVICSEDPTGADDCMSVEIAKAIFSCPLVN